MEITFSYQKKLARRIETIFSEIVGAEKLWIEFSIDYPFEYDTIYDKWENANERVPIEGFYGVYDIDKSKLVIYLPAISNPCCLLPYPFESLIKVIIYFEVGQWICKNVKVRQEIFSKEHFLMSGNIFRNFTAMMFGYELLRKDNVLPDVYKDFSTYLNDDYSLWLLFIETVCEDYYLPGLRKSDIYHLISDVLNNQRKDISRDYIVDYFFDDYVLSNIKKNPMIINHFWDFMTKEQKNRIKGLSIAKKFGFLDD